MYGYHTLFVLNNYNLPVLQYYFSELLMYWPFIRVY